MRENNISMAGGKNAVILWNYELVAGFVKFAQSISVINLNSESV